MENSITIKRIETFVFRVPIDQPVRTSFGSMLSRPAVVVRIEDNTGAAGWGEVWCNFPGCGAEHRANLLEEIASVHLIGNSLSHPEKVFRALTGKTHILGLQTGEEGAIAQVLAGVDIALWDLYSRIAGLPLHRLLNDQSTGNIPVYASGINPNNPLDTVERCALEGYTAFKLKVGFGSEPDLKNVGAIARQIGPHGHLMLDANQAWNLDTAKSMAKRLEAFPIVWLEEPIPADRPTCDWKDLSTATVLDLAAGENIRGDDRFESVIASGSVRVVQPDLCKWGGISGCFPVAKSVLRAGLRYCPHYLGGGIGLLASAHLLAAAGGDGLLEIDSNLNPLRQGLAQPHPVVEKGRIQLPAGDGLGIEPDIGALRNYLTAHKEIS